MTKATKTEATGPQIIMEDVYEDGGYQATVELNGFRYGAVYVMDEVRVRPHTPRSGYGWTHPRVKAAMQSNMRAVERFIRMRIDGIPGHRAAHLELYAEELTARA